MGWGSGSELMRDVIEAVKSVIGDAETRKQLYVPIIKAFEGQDCDTLQDCTGDDPAYDAALEQTDPTWGGLKAAERKEPRKSNPWPKRTREHTRWNEGWDWYSD